MGLGDSVPGVSGATIAVVTRIYEELIFSIRQLDITFVRLLLQLKLNEAWRHMNGSFLIILALGFDHQSGVAAASSTKRSRFASSV